MSPPTSAVGWRPTEGGCDCRRLRYRVESRPLFVHCCHCRWCQRETGSAFALNALIESDWITVLDGEPRLVDTPSSSGRGQRIARCPYCQIAVWSHYAGAGAAIKLVRVGTLDEPDRLPPDIHIFTASKQPWVVIPADAAAVPEYYDRRAHWPEESLRRCAPPRHEPARCSRDEAAGAPGMTGRTPQIVLITGASRGIGAATARLAAERGYAVCVNYRADRHAAEHVARGIVSKGGHAIAVAADVSIESQVVRLFDECDKRLGGLSALVNNAGVLETQMRVEQMDAARISRVLATNVVGPFICAREAVRRMSVRAGGRGGGIVNVSSGAARLGAPNEYVDYAASKGALDTLTIGLAREVATEGIRVNGVRAGYIHTEMHASGGEPDRIQRVKADVPMQRGGTPEEVAQAILWLLSEQSSFVTGSFIDVSGGR